jgi:hypothetical protein
VIPSLVILFAHQPRFCCSLIDSSDFFCRFQLCWYDQFHHVTCLHVSKRLAGMAVTGTFIWYVLEL